LLLEYIFVSIQYNYNSILHIEKLSGLIYLAYINWYVYKICSTDPSPYKI